MLVKEYGLYRKFVECEGDICHRIPLAKEENNYKDWTINTCMAESEDGEHWQVPEGWKVFNGKIYCPRCVEQYLGEK